jgi:hypothetical protein
MATTSRQISWTHDFDAGLEKAKAQRHAVLVDFTAAPM